MLRSRPICPKCESYLIGYALPADAVAIYDGITPTGIVVVHRDDASRITRDDVVHGAAVCLDCATAFDATAWGMP